MGAWSRNCCGTLEGEREVPYRNGFRHQDYQAGPPAVDVAWLDAVAPPAPDSVEWRNRMSEVGRCLRASGVSAVYLLHGTFVGDDLLGFSHLASLLHPPAAKLLREQEKRLADWFVRDAGNYTAEFAAKFEREINPEGIAANQRIPVRLFHWTSENHHLGRADGAVRLIDAMSQARLRPGSRVLIWGHSHGGNVMALLSNLWAADERKRDEFFRAVERFRNSRLVAADRRESWRRVREYLAGPRESLRDVGWDMVTFGTPIRYGWDTAGYARLLHVIYHRPTEGLPAYVTRFPFSLRSALKAKRGDYVQQVGIAGTNILPPLVAFPAHLADRSLARLLQPEWGLREIWGKLCVGQRVPSEGDTLLIDYHRAAPRQHRSARGHGIYTRTNWLLYHAELVAKRWYADECREGLRVEG